MKLNYAPQAGLRRRKPSQRRETLAFWAGIGVMVLFELVLMAKNFTPTGLFWAPPAADLQAGETQAGAAQGDAPSN